MPKGVIDPGRTALQTASQEAWEEAGIKGTLCEPPIGEYQYRKWDDELSVKVFHLEVTSLEDDWPERTIRQRILVSPKEAVNRMEEDDLRKLLSAYIKSGSFKRG